MASGCVWSRDPDSSGEDRGRRGEQLPVSGGQDAGGAGEGLALRLGPGVAVTPSGSVLQPLGPSLDPESR